MNLKAVRKLAYRSFSCYRNAAVDIVNHDGIEHAGYISFLLMLSIFPFFIFLSALLSSNQYISDALRETVFSIAAHLLENNNNFTTLIGALQPRLEEIMYRPPQSLLGLAIFSTMWSASSILDGLRNIISRAYRMQNTPSYILGRLLSVFQFILITFLVVALAFVIKVVPMLLQLISDSIEIFEENIVALTFVTGMFKKFSILNKYINDFISGIVLFLFLAYLYYIIPNKKQKFTHVLPGIFNTMFFWWLSTNALQYYIVMFPQISLVYGSIAGIIIALLYFYICSGILIYGAELNYCFCQEFHNNEKKDD